MHTYGLSAWHIPTVERVRTPTAMRGASVTPWEIHSLRPPSSPHHHQTETKQMQSRNMETLHRRTQSPGCSHKGSSALHRSSPRTAGSQTAGHLVFRDGVNKNNYDTLITVLIAAALVFRVNGPDSSSSTQVAWWDVRSQTRPRLALVWGGVTPSGLKCACCSCQVCLQLCRIKQSSNAIFTLCDVGQSAFHRLSNDV